MTDDDQSDLFGDAKPSKRSPVRNDRSVLSALGFNDPDKKDFRHDAACRYITENANTIAVRCTGSEAWIVSGVRCEQERHLRNGRNFTVGFIDVFTTWDLRHVSRMCDRCAIDLSVQTIVEVKIAKVCVGDAIRQLKLYRDMIAQDPMSRERCIDHHRCAATKDIEDSADAWWSEKKASMRKEPSAVDLVEGWAYRHAEEEYRKKRRQGKEEFISTPTVVPMVLVTAYAITEYEHDALREAEILHFRLGAKFDAWLSESKIDESQEI